MGEGDKPISLLGRLLQHAEATARYNVYFGKGRDTYDVRGRVAHESIFNLNDGAYRCPSSQQGYSPFTTWTRGLAWVICGYAEQLEFLATPAGARPSPAWATRDQVLARFLRGRRGHRRLLHRQHARPTASPTGTPARPGLAQLGDYLGRARRPVQRARARRQLRRRHRRPGPAPPRQLPRRARRGRQGQPLPAGRPHRGPHALRRALPLAPTPTTRACCCTPSTTGPTAGTTCPTAARSPAANRRMWGDYHARELALLLLRQAENRPYLKFFLD